MKKSYLLRTNLKRKQSESQVDLRPVRTYNPFALYDIAKLVPDI
jgi:hypothetical protein